MIKTINYITKHCDSYNQPYKTNERITPSEGVSFNIKVPIHNKKLTHKDKLFYDLLNWYENYKPSESKEYVKFQLQNTFFKIKNNKVILIKWFRNIQKLKPYHFENWNINKFILN